MGRIFKTWVVWSLVFAGLYLLLVSQLKGPEICAAFICGGFGAMAYTATKFRGRLEYRLHLGWLRHLAKLPIESVTDTFTVFGALWSVIVLNRPVRSRFIGVPFDYGGQDGSSCMRRSLIAAGISFPPNSYLVTANREEEILLVHQLVPTKEPPGKGDREWPL